MAKNWYVIHVHSGYEKKVATHISEQAEREGLADRIADILVPMEKIVDIRKGRKVSADQKFFPGYVLVCMDLTDDTWHLVRNTPKVTGFLGSKSRPTPISPQEAERILTQSQQAVIQAQKSVIYEIGEQVRVADGPFASFNGIVEEVDDERNRLKVSVSIFGRSTPVELEYNQVEKNPT